MLSFKAPLTSSSLKSITIKNATLNGTKFEQPHGKTLHKSSMEAYEVRQDLLDDPKQVLYS
jgi:hypothetical protein